MGRGKGAVSFTAKTLKQLLVLSLCLSRFFFLLHLQDFNFCFQAAFFFFSSTLLSHTGWRETCEGRTCGVFVFSFIYLFWVQKMPAKGEPAIAELNRRVKGFAASGGSQYLEADWKHHV